MAKSDKLSSKTAGVAGLGNHHRSLTYRQGQTGRQRRTPTIKEAEAQSSSTTSKGPYDRNFQQHLTDNCVYPHV